MEILSSLKGNWVLWKILFQLLLPNSHSEAYVKWDRISKHFCKRISHTDVSFWKDDKEYRYFNCEKVAQARAKIPGECVPLICLPHSFDFLILHPFWFFALPRFNPSKYILPKVIHPNGTFTGGQSWSLSQSTAVEAMTKEKRASSKAWQNFRPCSYQTSTGENRSLVPHLFITQAWQPHHLPFPHCTVRRHRRHSAAQTLPEFLWLLLAGWIETVQKHAATREDLLGNSWAFPVYTPYTYTFLTQSNNTSLIFPISASLSWIIPFYMKLVTLLLKLLLIKLHRATPGDLMGLVRCIGPVLHSKDYFLCVVVENIFHFFLPDYIFLNIFMNEPIIWFNHEQKFIASGTINANKLCRGSHWPCCGFRAAQLQQNSASQESEVPYPPPRTASELLEKYSFHTAWNSCRLFKVLW